MFPPEKVATLIAGGFFKLIDIPFEIIVKICLTQGLQRHHA